MNFYAYKPNEDGSEPLGTFKTMIIRNMKTVNGAKRKARRVLGNNCRVFSYTNLYDQKTFTEV